MECNFIFFAFFFFFFFFFSPGDPLGITQKKNKEKKFDRRSLYSVKPKAVWALPD
jgi:hypothetical protein